MNRGYFTQAEVFEGNVLVYSLEYETKETENGPKVVLVGKLPPTGYHDWIPWESAGEAHVYARDLLRARYRGLARDVLRLTDFLSTAEARPKAIDDAEALFREHSLSLARRALKDLTARMQRVKSDLEVAETSEIRVLEEVGGTP